MFSKQFTPPDVAQRHGYNERRAGDTLILPQLDHCEEAFLGKTLLACWAE